MPPPAPAPVIPIPVIQYLQDKQEIPPVYEPPVPVYEPPVPVYQPPAPVYQPPATPCVTPLPVPAPAYSTPIPNPYASDAAAPAANLPPPILVNGALNTVKTPALLLSLVAIALQ
jgi:hypothetical protein